MSILSDTIKEDLQKRSTKVINGLNGLSHGDYSQEDILVRILREVEEFIPESVIDVYEKLL